MAEPATHPISVVGLVGGTSFGDEARAAIGDATVLIGSQRQLALVKSGAHATRVVLQGALGALFDCIDDHRRSGASVCVLASGDPGFFGIVRALRQRFGGAALRVHPAPSSIALAFARVARSWDDAVIVSAHGRPIGQAVDIARRHEKVAVLTSPEHPPEAIGAALLHAACAARHVTVVSRIGEPGEVTVEGDLSMLAAGTFDPLSVVILETEHPDATDRGPGVAWGLDSSRFAHRAGMITKAEVRAVVLGKLALPRTGVLWDVGAGSGSVGIEAAGLCPDLRVIAIERDAASAERIGINASEHGVDIEVIHGDAPDALAALPDPDRVFVGGGGLLTLETVLERLRPDGTVVATYAVLDRAVQAWHALGSVIQIGISRGIATGELGVRLSAENPVFVCWGPAAAH
jgi:precorrin-6B C5,15-methyltransferase / cobalt-precorrin-6B C5,C15-methyltransferase